MLGEETVLLKALEGKRGQPEQRPPQPATRGLFGEPDGRPERPDPGRRPVDPRQRRRGVRRDRLEGEPRHDPRLGPDAGRRRASPRSRSARRSSDILALAGKESDRNLKAILVGGPSGGILPAAFADTPYEFEALRAVGAHVGSGSIVAADKRACIVDLARLLTRYCADEACGKTIPCRIGLRRVSEIGDRIATGVPKPTDG